MPLQVSELISGLLRALDADIQGSCTLAFHDVDAALVASDLFSNEVLSVQGFEAHNQAGILLIVGVPSGQVCSSAKSGGSDQGQAAMSHVTGVQEEEAVALTKWRGPAVVLLSLDTNSITSKMSRLRNSFQTVFAFEPFATKVSLLSLRPYPSTAAVQEATCSSCPPVRLTRPLLPRGCCGRQKA